MAKKIEEASLESLIKPKKKEIHIEPPDMRPFSVSLKDSDVRRIRRLLFMGIILNLKKKREKDFKVWVLGFQKIFTKARTPASAYRKMFKRLREEGIYIR